MAAVRRLWAPTPARCGGRSTTWPTGSPQSSEKRASTASPRARDGRCGPAGTGGYTVGVEAQVQPAYWTADWSRYVMRGLILLLFIASILKLSAQSFSPFLYFQF